MIMFLDIVEECAGATATIPRDFSPAAADPTTSTRGRSKQTHPEIYAHEQQVRFKPGTMLLWRQDTFHRGTPVREGSLRRVHGIVYRREECSWTQDNVGCDPSLLSALDPWQRSVIGFPKLDDPYWRLPGAVELVGDRYPEMDMAPYKETGARL